MNSLIKKITSGVKINPVDTIVKSIRYALWRAGQFADDVLYYVFAFLLIPIRFRTQVRLKHRLSPTTKLDYARALIKLKADSMLDVFRARACEKEPETIEWIESYVNKGDVFFDVGANIGAYSLVACAHCKGNVKVLSFEPSFSNYYQLCRNIIVNDFGQSITPYMIALSDSPGLLSFNYRSLEAGSADHWLGESEESSQFVYTQQLLVFSIDHLISEFGFPVPNHIKLDVDGSEYKVICGAEKTLQNNSLKSILVEVRDTDEISRQVDEKLKEANFTLVSKTLRGKGDIWNCVYARDVKR